MYEKEKAYPAWHGILHRARHGRVAFDSRPGEFFGISGYHELHCVVCGLVQFVISYEQLTVRTVAPPMVCRYGRQRSSSPMR